MKPLLVAFLFCLAPIASSAQESEFKFRNDDRPTFAKSVDVAQLKELQASEGALVLDVRLEEDFAKNPNLISGSTYRNPEDLPNWISLIDKSKEVVVYCVAGKWVSQKVAYLLDEAGITVRSLEGGYNAWNNSTEH
jgi:rhodanese-related sulfurtransferase